MRNFLFFIVKFHLERYVALSDLKSCQTSQSNNLSRTLHSAGYECYRVADHHRPATAKKLSTIHAAKFPINQKESFHFNKLTNHLSMVALAGVKYQCTDLR